MNNTSSSTAKEGYLIIAMGQKKYLEMALNLALSIKLKDERPICLLHDDSFLIPLEYSRYFAYFVQVSLDDQFHGVEHKLRILNYSPFERTMFIDADSLLIKNDIEYLWSELNNNYDFTVIGHKVFEGSWGGRDIGSIIKELSLPYMIKTNSGVIYFKKTLLVKDVFNKALEYFTTFKHILSWRIGHVKDVCYSDEPFFCAAMAHFNLESMPGVVKDRSLMFSTINADSFNIDIKEGVCSFLKQGQDVSPTIVHFCRLQPQDIYLREVNKLRRHFGFTKIYEL